MAGNGESHRGLQHGEEDPDGVVVVLPDRGRGARSGQGSGDVAHERGRAPRAQGLRRPHPRRQEPPVERVHAQFIEKGGRFYVCPVCFNDRDLDEASSSPTPSSRARPR